LNKIVLELKRQLRVPVDSKAISPNVLSEKSLEEIAMLKVWEGNRQIGLGELFNIKDKIGGPTSDFHVVVSGDTRKIRCLGYRMSSGFMKIEGNTGMYIGEEMCGGSVSIEGSAESWLGSKMRGGSIEVSGDAGDHVGAAYRGSREGMTGGQITIHGNCGAEAGCWMSNGTVQVEGNAGMFPGIYMRGGVILIDGNCAGRAGAGMTGGTVVIRGKMETILPSFSIDEIRKRVKVGEEAIEGPFYVFRGDVGSARTGRIFVNIATNPQLKWCEEYLEAW
jgi:formylmethanofuran dehydrogenase subunit C